MSANSASNNLAMHAPSQKEPGRAQEDPRPDKRIYIPEIGLETELQRAQRLAIDNAGLVMNKQRHLESAWETLAQVRKERDELRSCLIEVMGSMHTDREWPRIYRRARLAIKAFQS